VQQVLLRRETWKRGEAGRTPFHSIIVEKSSVYVPRKHMLEALARGFSGEIPLSQAHSPLLSLGRRRNHWNGKRGATATKKKIETIKFLISNTH
jgi:hypothetical protein